MNRYSDDTIQKVLAATNIVDLIGTYFPLKRAGKDFRANCPFHTEKTPSFYVIPTKQTYYCFGCGAGGTALRFVMEYENSDFRTALKKLADRAGILLPEEDAPDPEAERTRRRRTRLLAVLAGACRFFHEQLLAAPAAVVARDYLKGRGFTRETAVDWQLGYAPDTLEPLSRWAKENKFTARDLIDTGLVALKDEDRPAAGVYPRFRHRLMFPIHNDYGDVIAFSGRVLDPGSKLAKYLNSPETSIFHKGSTLYGLNRAKRPILKAGAAIVCEGQMDLIALATAGFTHAIAPLGTALTRDHARMLKRHTDTVVLCYDGDAAGWKAADRAFTELAPAGLSVKVAALPPGEDPDSLLRKDGADAVRALLDGAVSYLDFFFARRAEAIDAGDLAARTAVARDAATVVARFSDTLARENVLRQTAIRLSLETELFRREVRREVNRLAAEDRGGYAGESAPAPTDAPAPEDTPETRVLETILHLALLDAKARAILAGADGSACRDHPGARLLRDLLAANPDPANHSATNAFLAGLPGQEEAKLQALMSRRLPKDPVQGVRDCLAKLAELQRRAANRREFGAKLENRGLDIAEILAIQAKVQQQVVDRRNSVQDDAPVRTTQDLPPGDDPF